MLALVDKTPHASLAFARGDGTPGIAAVNRVRLGTTIYFHGAPEGEKMAALAANPAAALMMAQPFALVPSFFTGDSLACPASQYYRSVVGRGAARLVEDAEEKAVALRALLAKLQPEGGHDPIDAEDPRYRRQLDVTAVVALPVTVVTAKFKMGQNLPARRRREVARRFEERGTALDFATAAAMRADAPFG